jgi:hypothetical protein
LVAGGATALGALFDFKVSGKSAFAEAVSVILIIGIDEGLPISRVM